MGGKLVNFPLLSKQGHIMKNESTSNEKSVETVAPKKILGMQEILDAQDIVFKELDVPEWGGTIRIGSLTAGDMIEFIEANEGPAKRTAGLRLIVKSLVDADGNRIGEDKHISIFRNRSQAVCNRVVEEIVKLNGLEIKNRTDAKNDSGEAQPAASPTVLH